MCLGMTLVLARQRQENPWSLLASYSSQIDELQFQRGTISQKTQWKITEKYTGHQLLAGAHMSMHTLI